MTFNRECVTCKHLNICTITSSKKVLSHYVCRAFEEVENSYQVVKARCDIITRFGEAGINALAPLNNIKEPNE